MPAGRPIEYNESIIERIEDYLATCVDNDETKEVNIPTIDGLAYYLGISRDTIYDWEKKYKEFSYIIEDLRAKQAKELINKGLSGRYNPTIAKVLLTKHGYREGIDQTTNDKDLPTPILGNVSSNNSIKENTSTDEES